MVDPGADDDHGPAVCVDRVVGKLAGDFDDEIPLDTGDRFLPCWRERHLVVVRAGDCAADAAVNAVVGQNQIIDGCHIHVACFGAHFFTGTARSIVFPPSSVKYGN